MTKYRQEEAYRIRVAAAAIARDRKHPNHHANGDEQRYAAANYAMCFTKGLRHKASNGLIIDKEDFERFRAAIDDGFIDAFTTRVRVSSGKGRPWEAPTAGVTYDLEGPDPQAVTMAPAPALGSDELAYEMAEVYELALLRDEPLADFKDGSLNVAVNDAVSRLGDLRYAVNGLPGRPRTNEGGNVTAQTLFRGSSKNVAIGPYLSQFMLIGSDQPGNPGVAHGFVQYGALQINQRVPVATQQNYMTALPDWLDAQNGVKLRNNATLFEAATPGEAAPRRFITFPRDLATYVHDDALYESYLNACLILLSMEAPFDPAFSNLSGQGSLFLNSLDINGNFLAGLESHARQAGGFALYGGPHILTLVTEVATRALKAVRYQKYNTHIRLRPEALAARVEKASAIETDFPQIGTPFSDLAASIAPTVGEIRAINSSGTALLPMAFQEGSPMHPSYGAGHAAVAGACVTILKAFFDTTTVFVRRGNKDLFAQHQANDVAVQYAPDATGANLVASTGGDFLTLEGELNKLAANISIGRDWAGVHYYSDYVESLRMGERIAIGILKEQKLMFQEEFHMSFTSFDGIPTSI